MSNSTTGGGDSGDVVGPASSTDNAVARFDSTTGKLLQDSVVIVDDVGVTSGITQLDVDNIRIDGNTIISTDVDGNITITPNGTGVIAGTELTLTTDLAVAHGGTGASTLTGVLTGNGTSAVTANAVTQYGVLVGGASNAVASTAVGTATEVLTSNGAGVAPTFQAAAGGIGGSTGATDNALLKADGTGGSTAQSEPDMTLTDTGLLLGPDGTNAAPTYAFASSAFSGFYLTGSGLGFTFNNQLRMEIKASTIDGNFTTGFALGRNSSTVTAPTYHFDGDSNTGMYRVTTDHLGFSTAGTVALDINASQVVTLANALVETSGGTGAATYAAGDILYASAANTLSKLAKGSDTEVLTLASGVPSWSAPGTQVQQIRAVTTALHDALGDIPVDDTIPQNTEGTEIVTVTITPTATDSVLLVEAACNVVGDGNTSVSAMAIFRDATVGAIAATTIKPDGVMVARVWVTSGALSATTFKMRAGPDVGDDCSVNGKTTGRYFGGVASTTITVTEYTA